MAAAADLRVDRPGDLPGGAGPKLASAPGGGFKPGGRWEPYIITGRKIVCLWYHTHFLRKRNIELSRTFDLHFA